MTSVTCGIDALSRPFRAYVGCSMPVSQGVALGFHVYGLSGQNAETPERAVQSVRLRTLFDPKCGIDGLSRPFRAYVGCSMPVSQGVALGFHVYGLSGQNAETPERAVQSVRLRTLFDPKCGIDGLSRPFRAYVGCSMPVSQGVALGFHVYGLSGQNAETPERAVQSVRLRILFDPKCGIDGLSRPFRAYVGCSMPVSQGVALGFPVYGLSGQNVTNSRDRALPWALLFTAVQAKMQKLQTDWTVCSTFHVQRFFRVHSIPLNTCKNSVFSILRT